MAWLVLLANSFPLPLFPRSPIQSSSPPPCLFSADDPPLFLSSLFLRHISSASPIPPSSSMLYTLIILPSPSSLLFPSPPSVSNFHFCPFNRLLSLIRHTCPPFWTPVFRSPPPSIDVPFFIVFSDVSARILPFVIIFFCFRPHLTPVLLYSPLPLLSSPPSPILNCSAEILDIACLNPFNRWHWNHPNLRQWIKSLTVFDYHNQVDSDVISVYTYLVHQKCIFVGKLAH